MKEITASFQFSYVIHEDNFTETVDGITTLLEMIKREGNITHAPLCRSIIMMSHLMIENVFWNAANEFLEKNKLHKCCINKIEEDKNRKIGISKAMAEWPEILVGKCFDYSSEPFSSIKCLIDERNQIAHSNRISYYSYYIDTYNGATSAYFTALEGASSIWQHFFGSKRKTYESFVKTFPPPREVYFQTALNDAKKFSTKLLEPESFPQELKTLQEYKNCPSQLVNDAVSEVFGIERSDVIRSALEICEYRIKVTDYFRKSYSSLSDKLKGFTLKNISPLLRTLTKKKMMSHYGVRFGEVLPHIKLNIKRIKFKNHHGYMCMPIEKYLFVFIIDTNTIELTDIIK